ncbi:hypothetical protein, partial [Marinospirillum sp.]|uniref:hypothetical protein n=1 Tax=Marinospirillum sp. TaxID=2183934 RepID=UPI0025C03E48
KDCFVVNSNITDPEFAKMATDLKTTATLQKSVNDVYLKSCLPSLKPLHLKLTQEKSGAKKSEAPSLPGWQLTRK